MNCLWELVHLFSFTSRIGRKKKLNPQQIPGKSMQTSLKEGFLAGFLILLLN